MDKKMILLRSLLIFIPLLVLYSCSMDDVTNLRINDLTVLATDENNAPIAGAIVQTSDGQSKTTGADGKVQLKFPAYGEFEITVNASGRAPATLSVTMPSDRNNTVTARLGKEVTPGSMSANININISGLTAGLSRLMSQMYPMIFQSMFSANGYSIDLTGYRPGQWTEWSFKDNQQFNGTLRKAYLKKLKNGEQWWQIVYTPDSGDKMTMEVLFSKGRTSIRRMRQKVGKQAAQEVPVSEGWYTAPTKLTKESIEGAVVKRHTRVKVPAGTYTADLLRFGQTGTDGSLSIWRTSRVPGGVVKTEVKDPDGSVMTSELKATGSGAKTLLHSY